MTNLIDRMRIERKALELVNEVCVERSWNTHASLPRDNCSRTEALCRALERHEAFRQEVSDAAEHLCKFYGVPIVMQQLERFIIPKPDPLEDIIKRNYAGSMSPPQIAYAIRKELDERGLEIREKSE